MALEEDPELVQRPLGDDVDEYSAAGQVDADREAFGEVPGGAHRTLADSDVGQHGRVYPRERRQVRGLLLNRTQSHQIGIFDDGVEDHQPLNGVAERQRPP